MKVKWFSKGIRVMGAQVKQLNDPVRGAHFGPPEELTENYGPLFVDFTMSLLDQIAAVPMGRELLSEIDGSERRLTICHLGAGGVACAEPTDATVIRRYFKTFRKHPPVAVRHMQANLGALPEWQLTQPDTYYTHRLSQAIRRSPFTQDAVARLAIDPHLIPPAYVTEYRNMFFDPPLLSVATRARNDAAYRARLANKKSDIREQRLQDMIDGHVEIDDVTYLKLSLHLHDWLERGEGINVVIGFSANPKSACAEDACADWEKGDVPFIILAHELIHAWRMMTGRRIFLGGIGEEHMTTGLPPYTSMKFTENKLRAQANLAIRDHYQAAIHDPFSGSLAIPWTSRVGRENLAKYWAANVQG